MKQLVLCLVLFAGLFSAVADEIPEYLLDMADEYGDRAKLFSINDDDVEDESGTEFFVLNFTTYQDDTHKKPFDYALRITVQLTDRKTDMVIYDQIAERVQQIRASSMRYYQGTEWEYRIPLGDMEKPKLSACAIEFGFEKDGYFVPLAVDYDGVDSADEILNGGGQEVKMKRTRKKHIWPR